MEEKQNKLRELSIKYDPEENEQILIGELTQELTGSDVDQGVKNYLKVYNQNCSEGLATFCNKVLTGLDPEFTGGLKASHLAEGNLQSDYCSLIRDYFINDSDYTKTVQRPFITHKSSSPNEFNVLLYEKPPNRLDLETFSFKAELDKFDSRLFLLRKGNRNFTSGHLVTLCKRKD